MSESPVKKYESTTEPGLFYWAQSGGADHFYVVAQAEGGPATEAWDDWFANFKDADEIAQMLARGEDPNEPRPNHS